MANEIGGGKAIGMGDRALAAARLWLGTPYLHQASAQGIGTDCLGLIRGVWRGLYGAEPVEVPAYSPDWGDAAGQELLAEAAALWLVPKPRAAVAAGDVLLFRMRAGHPAKHLGLQGRCGAQASFLHAYSGHQVVESPLSEPWARRVVARFGWPDLDPAPDPGERRPMGRGG